MLGRTNAVIGSSGGGGTSGEFLCTVVDYDGTILKQEWLNNGDTFELPQEPNRTSEGLKFDGWISPQTITNGKMTVSGDDIIVGPMYDTVSGYSELIINVGDGKKVTLSSGLSGEKDWGDGTVDSTQVHTYANGGQYKITLKGSFTTFVKAITDTNGINIINEARISGSVTTLDSSCFNGAKVERLVISKKVTTLGNQYVFAEMTEISTIIIPNSITELTGYCFNCNSSGGILQNLVIPNSITKISTYTFYGINVERLILPTTITGTISIFSGAYTASFSKMSNIRKLHIPNFMKEISLSSEHALRTLTFANDITKVSFDYLGLSEINLPDTVASVSISSLENLISISIPNNAKMYYMRYSNKLCSVTFKGNVSAEGIPSYCFQGNYNCMKYDFSHCTTIPALANANAFNNAPTGFKILVPSALADTWKAETNWSTYASNIVGV